MEHVHCEHNFSNWIPKSERNFPIVEIEEELERFLFQFTTNELVLHIHVAAGYFPPFLFDLNKI